MSEYENNRTVSNALPVGYRFNEFEIKEVIGGGGFGIVYRAWDHQLERTIAIKEFMPSSLAVRNDDMRLVLRSERFGKAFTAGLNSFIQEARLLARFNHPNLLHVLRFWVHNDTAYMGTAFYSGTTLSRLREQHPERIDETWIRRMLPMLLGAVKTIHQEGYLHRDISLDNIQIQDNGLPVLLDFGSARRSIGNISDETETMLRPGFAPIEQYTDDNDSEQGPWTDIYALGAVLHTLVVGSPPPVSVVRSIEDNYQPLMKRRPQGYSPALLNAIDQALALKMEDRPQSVDAFAALVETAVAGIDDVAQVNRPGTMLVPVETEEEPQKPAGLKRFMVPGLVAAGVLVGIALGGVLFHGGGSESVPTASEAPTPATPADTASDNTAAVAANTPSAPATTTAPVATNAEPVALVYVRMREGDQLTLNGKQQAVVPASNGFASLQLPAGQYELKVTGHGDARNENITVDRPGTWFINPQS